MRTCKPAAGEIENAPDGRNHATCPSYAGLTHVSVRSAKAFSLLIDRRVKPGDDGSQKPRPHRWRADSNDIGNCSNVWRDHVRVLDALRPRRAGFLRHR